MMKTAPVVLLAAVDDDVRQVSALALARDGVRVEQADSAEQAFHKASELLPDALVAHVTLPHLDGIALRERLRAHARTRSIPILIVSGSPGTWLDAVAIASRVVWWRRGTRAIEMPRRPLTLN